MIEAHLPPERGTVVLHWFTGSKSDARRAAALGCYFSINAEMTRTDRGRDLIRSLPRDRILTETDGPFTQVEGRPSEPSDVLDVIAGIGARIGLPADVAAKAVLSNLRSLLA
jgi:TatD DNase family protein